MTVNHYGPLLRGRASLTPEIRASIDDARAFGLALVKLRTPVKTGLLKGQWQARNEGLGIRWTNDTPYSVFVEFGTSKMAPRAMLGRSVPDIKEFFRRRLESRVGSRLGAELVTGRDYRANPPSLDELVSRRTAPSGSDAVAQSARARLNAMQGRYHGRIRG